MRVLDHERETVQDALGFDSDDLLATAGELHPNTPPYVAAYGMLTTHLVNLARVARDLIERADSE